MKNKLFFLGVLLLANFAVNAMDNASTQPCQYKSENNYEASSQSLDSGYAYRFLRFPENSAFRVACLKNNTDKKAKKMCAELSNYLHCTLHPEVENRPQECKDFCKDYTNTSRLKKLLTKMQRYLNADPQEIITYMRVLHGQDFNISPAPRFFSRLACPFSGESESGDC